MNEKFDPSVNQREPLVEESCEVVNFVWVGPPKYGQGGQDVIGITSMAENFKQFGQNNPLIFWCQAEYKEDYIQFFAREGISVKVLSIEEHLEALKKEVNDPYIKKKAYEVFQIYSNLKGRTDDVDIQIKDRVRIKDLFFLFLMASGGGYALDSNVCARENFKANFPSFEDFHFPLIIKNSEHSSVECWMMYSPKEKLERARSSLNLAINSYAFNQLAFFEHKKNNFGTGNMTLDWLTLGKRDKKEEFKENTWETRYNQSTYNYIIQELNICKEYYNSHYLDREQRYDAAHLHAISGQVKKVEKDLYYGIDPKTLMANTRKDNSKFNHDSERETLLHSTLRCLKTGPKESSYLECAKLYLEKGADPNALYYYNRYDQEGKKRSKTEHSPLFDAIINKSINALILLCEYGADVSQNLNGKSLLTAAVSRNFNPAVEELLKRGANPNQFSKPEYNPLYIALKNKNTEITSLLLEYGAKISEINLPYVTSSDCKDLIEKFKRIESLKEVSPRFYAPLTESEAGEKEEGNVESPTKVLYEF